MWLLTLLVLSWSVAVTVLLSGWALVVVAILAFSLIIGMAIYLTRIQSLERRAEATERKVETLLCEELAGQGLSQCSRLRQSPMLRP